MEKQTFLWFLEKEEVNKFFSLAELRSIQREKSIQKYSRRDYFNIEQNYRNKSFFLEKGKVEIAKQSMVNGKNKQLTICILHPGSIWSFSDLTNTPSNFKSTSTYIVKILKESSLLSLDNMEDLFLDKNTARTYLNIFATQRSRIEQRVANYVYKDARTRVIEYILFLLKKRGQSKGSLILLKPFFTHNELSKLINTTRQIVTTVLNELRTKEILAFDRNILIIKNYQSLVSEIKNEKKRVLEIQK